MITIVAAVPTEYIGPNGQYSRHGNIIVCRGCGNQQVGQVGTNWNAATGAWELQFGFDTDSFDHELSCNPPINTPGLGPGKQQKQDAYGGTPGYEFL